LSFSSESAATLAKTNRITKFGQEKIKEGIGGGKTEFLGWQKTGAGQSVNEAESGPEGYRKRKFYVVSLSLPPLLFSLAVRSWNYRLEF